MTRTSDYFYVLPQNLIAQTPSDPRDSAKLLIYNKLNKSIEDSTFSNIFGLLNSGDVLVVNNTKVIPARLFGVKQSTNGNVEILLLKRLDINKWEVILKPGKSVKKGTVINIGNGKLIATVLDVISNGNRILQFDYEGVFEEILSQLGQMPLPHYITKQLEDKLQYNTVYSKIEGSAAAPTAGLHFTQQLLQSLKDKGVIIVEVLLHIGLGTFRPVKTDIIEEHHMHSEYYEVTQTAADTINQAINDKRRIIAVGTTSVRVLESAVNNQGLIEAGTDETNIFIFPPYKFKVVNALITNFHLPSSTLLMLVAAFTSREEVLRIYQYAIEHEYKFFSFGDACFFY